MKRTALDNPKIDALCHALNVQRWGAIGILESLWHFTAKHAVQGDIGRWSDRDLARFVGWTRGDSRLIAGLLATKWLDSDPIHRLLVHDWAEHCDQSVRKTLVNRGLAFAVPNTPFRNGSGTLPSSRIEKNGLPCLAEAEAEPVPSLAEAEPSTGPRPAQPPAAPVSASGLPPLVSDSDSKRPAAPPAPPAPAAGLVSHMPSTADGIARVLQVQAGYRPPVDRVQKAADRTTWRKIGQAVMAGFLGPPIDAYPAAKFQAAECMHADNRTAQFVAWAKRRMAENGHEWTDIPQHQTQEAAL